MASPFPRNAPGKNKENLFFTFPSLFVKQFLITHHLDIWGGGEYSFSALQIYFGKESYSTKNKI
jgi:hypothetical protein